MPRCLPYLASALAGAALASAGAWSWSTANLGVTWLPLEIAARQAELAERRGRDDALFRCLALRLGELGEELEGLDEDLVQAEVTVTAYHPVRAQTDSTPGTTASNRPSRPGRTCAVSRPLRARLGLSWGDALLVPGRGLWVIEDLMGPRIQHDAVDLMLPIGAPGFSEVARVTVVRGGR